MTETVLIAHGRLRSSRHLQEFVDNDAITVLFTEYSGHAIDLAQESAAGASCIIVAGGDGTLNEVINGVMQVEPHRRPTIQLVPLGTGNDTARTLTLTRGMWDVVRAKIGRGSEQTKRYGVNISDVGLGGSVVTRYTDRLRSLPGQLGYAFAVIRTLLAFRARPMRITLDERIVETTALMICVCNGQWFGGAVGIAPMADPTDGLLEVVVIGDVSVLTYLKYLPRLKRGEVIHDPRIQYDHANKVSVAADVDTPIEMDGEQVGETPVTFEVVPNAVYIELHSGYSK